MTRRLAVLALLWIPAAAQAASPKPGPPLTIRRVSGPITLDGDLSDPGWKGADSVTTWFETRVGDNVEPQVRNLGFLAYDDHYLYAGFHFEDPNPKRIRAPIGDHDAIQGSMDYGGVIIDSRNDSKTARMFLANPHGVQYDAVTSDVTGEDSSPDFYWDAVGKITPTGWNLEIRIPFSSLRYASDSLPTWGILLYRNYPRDRHYQFFSARLPRDVSCFICNSSKLTGLADLPHDSHLVVAPFATAEKKDELTGDAGSPLEDHPVKGDGGVDVKWNPAGDQAIDGAWRPDFSQVESDAAQITANERFAVFYPEKRPFFLEGIDLFSTPFQAVYTRTVTAPDWGVRATGRFGTSAYTVLATHDRGGGSVIIPGPQGSNFAPQDFASDVGIVRIRHDMGQSFVSVLGTAQQVDGGGHNYVGGPDLQWRPRPTDAFTGQALWSQTQTPARPDLAGEWDGRTLDDHAALLNWSHNTPHFDWFLQGQDLGPDFRANNGFIPQVGFREAFLDGGYTIRPGNFFISRQRFFTTDYLDLDPSGNTLARHIALGTGGDGKLSTFFRLELNHDDILVSDTLLSRFRPRFYVEASLGRFINFISLDSYFGQEIDFDNARRGTGATLIGSVTLRPSDHLELRGDGSTRWINETTPDGHSGRLFLADVGRLRLTWSFSSRSYVRLIGQFVKTTRDTSLYTFEIEPKDADLSGSALFAYKLNWQSVLFLGYGDDRTFADLTGQYTISARQAFAKISYAFQI
ncbi:MAG TPA: DUF5916 domain-containing protein [Candidatus Sulfotelmatobacter sp.]|nr:DUF5916 domain-containing protein [Candidatus Sulfotelmatobacter sp.]